MHRGVNILLIASGHSFATLDVAEGYRAGLSALGVDVTYWKLHEVQQTLHLLRTAAEGAGLIPEAQQERFQQYITSIASADAVTLALLHDVDAVVVVYGLLFPIERVAALRKLRVPVVCIGTEAPYDEKERQIAPHYSHFFTNERTAVPAFRDAGATAHYLPTAWHPERHRPGPADPAKAVDLCFIGGFYRERKALIEAADLSGVRCHFAGTLATSDNPFEGVIDNAEVADWYRSARLSLNLHRRTANHWEGTTIAAAAESLNPRCYEVAACGGFLLTDPRAELADVFGDAAATFRAGDPDDLSRQVRYWLRHPDRYEATKAAQHEAVQGHSYTHRARVLLETII